MAEASRRTKFWVWAIVLVLFAAAAWFAISTIRSSMQPLGVLNDPFPAEEQRPEGTDGDRSAMNFLVFGEAESTHQTLSIFHLAEGRRRIDILNFPTNSAVVSDLQDIPATVQEVEALTEARMEHVMLWDLEFLAELDSAPMTAEEIATNPAVLDGDTVWTTVLQEALDVSDAGQLRTVADTLTPYVAADAELNTGRITELARSLRHVAPESVDSCVLPSDFSDGERWALRRYFEQSTPARCAELFDTTS